MSTSCRDIDPVNLQIPKAFFFLICNLNLNSSSAYSPLLELKTTKNSRAQLSELLPMQKSITLVIPSLDSRVVLVLICGSYPRMAIPLRMAMPYGIRSTSDLQCLARVCRATQPRSHRHCLRVTTVPLKLVERMNRAIQTMPSGNRSLSKMLLITRAVRPCCRRVASPQKLQQLFP